MKSLIIGGYSYYGFNIAQRLNKEGSKVFVIDNLSSNKVKNYSFKHKLYKEDIRNQKIKYIFMNNDFDNVIYLVPLNIDNGITALRNCLSFSQKSNVKNFIFINYYKEDSIYDYNAAKSYLNDFNSDKLNVKVINIKDDNLLGGDTADAVYRLTYEYAETADDIEYDKEKLRSIGWTPRGRLNRQIPSKYISDENKKGIFNGILKKAFIPYIENISFFILMAVFNSYLLNNGTDKTFEISLIYIIIFSILYGIKQSSICSILSIILFIYLKLQGGQIAVSLIYNPDIIITILSFLFTGLIIGYLIDYKNEKIIELEDKIKQQESDFMFLDSMYVETKNDKKALEKQILNKEDSFGKLYKVTSKLNLLSPELIWDNSVDIICEIMKADSACIYLIPQKQKYLRLISKSKNTSSQIIRSINIEEYTDIADCIEEKRIFINKNMEKNIPIMMAPIVSDNETVALISINDIEFSEINLYKVNLFKVVSYLITGALSKAYLYEKAVEKDKYVEGSDIMSPKYFEQLLINKTDDYIILKADRGDYEKIVSCIRVVDYIGLNKNSEMFVVLTNTKREEAQSVIKRLNNRGVNVTITELSQVLFESGEEK